MRGFHLLAGVLVVGLMIAGCEKADDATGAVKDAGAKASDAAAGAADKAKEMGSDAVDKTKEMGAAVADQATKMVDQVKTYINEKKFTDAEALLTKLDGMRAQLPESIQKMIDDCKGLLAKAKAAMPK